MKIVIAGSRDRQLEEMLRPVAGQLASVASLSSVLGAASAADQPGVLVVDTRDHAGIPKELPALRQALPGVGIIVVAARLDPAVMLEAMRSGVNEFLTDPVSAADLYAAVERVSALKATPKVAKSYAFIGAKGGVGTTTVAVNVATALARTGTGRVLLIDLHPAYGDAALFFGAEPKFSVLDALENTHKLDDAFLKGLVVQTKTGLDLLGSSDRSIVAPVDAQRVRALIEFVSRSYAHVVLDVSRSDSAILDALDGLTNIVIVANQELSTVRGAARMAAALRQRYGKERVQVVVSRYDSASEIGQDDVERVTGGSVRHLFPSNYRLAVDALNKGRPIVVENHNKLAASFVGFARTLAGVPKPSEVEQPKQGLLGRLTSRR
jgi:pilus assembly protein CpaE